MMNLADLVRKAQNSPAEGAISNGTIIEKTNSDNGDHVSNGTRGKVTGSFKIPENVLQEAAKELNTLLKAKYMYVVEWDGGENIISLVVDFKIKEI